MKGSHDVFSFPFIFASTVLRRAVGTLVSRALLMIHYTCDRCKRQINTADQTRYIVQIDIHTAVDHSSEEMEDDVDHLAELHQMLEGIAESDVEDDEACESSHHGRYDLCPECHRQFLKNPLGRDAMHALGFSNN